MAIQRGPYGTGFVKRLGNTVGYKMGGGKYGMSAYQPEIINPRTVPQRVQRAKFAFLRKLGGMFGNVALMGLERQPYNTLSQAFMGVNMPLVMMYGEPYEDEVNVALTADVLKLSMGYEPTPYANLNNLVEGVFSFELRVPANDGNLPPDEAIIALAVDKLIGQDGYNAQVIRCAFTSDGHGNYTTGTKTVTVNTGELDPSVSAFRLYAYAYAVRYGGVSLNGFQSEMKTEQVHGEDAITYSSTATKTFTRHYFSPTIQFGANNIPH